MKKFLLVLWTFLIASNVFAAQDFLSQLPANVKQAIVVEYKSAGSHLATLTMFEKMDQGWKEIGDPLPAVIGRTGFASIGEKREGDGHTPSGIYKLGTAFGYNATTDTKLNYRQATENDFWVDDSKSAQYNQWVSGAPQANSFEKMKRDDDLYKLGVVIEYNTDPIVPGNGSAIFLHIWRGGNQPTSGCVALSEEDVRKLLAWLDVGSNPTIVLNP